MTELIIEHAALYAEDPEAVRDFFVQYLCGHSDEGYHNQKTGFRSYFISFDKGARLEIMNRPGMSARDHSGCLTGYNHVAFSVGSRENVNELTDQLRKAGFTVRSGPRITGDGYYESSIVAVEGNLIEITV